MGEAAADRVLWGCATSRTIRAHWALHELGLPYRCEPILARSGETLTPRYTAVNPRQKIPALQDGDLVVTESAARHCQLGGLQGARHRAAVRR